MNRTASCCCGKTSIELTGDPEINVICSCDDCKRRTGSMAGWSAYFNNAQVVNRTGHTETYNPATSPDQMRFFCAHCGSTLYWETGSFPDMTGVAGGNFTQTPLPDPQASHRDENRCRWFELPTAMNKNRTGTGTKHG